MLYWCPKCQEYTHADRTARVYTQAGKRLSETTVHCGECKTYLFKTVREIRIIKGVKRDDKA